MIDRRRDPARCVHQARSHPHARNGPDAALAARSSFHSASIASKCAGSSMSSMVAKVRYLLRDILDVPRCKVLMNRNAQHVLTEELRVGCLFCELRAVIPELERVHAAAAQRLRFVMLVVH